MNMTNADQNFAVTVAGGTVGINFVNAVGGPATFAADTSNAFVLVTFTISDVGVYTANLYVNSVFSETISITDQSGVAWPRTDLGDPSGVPQINLEAICGLGLGQPLYSHLGFVGGELSTEQITALSDKLDQNQSDYVDPRPECQ